MTGIIGAIDTQAIMIDQKPEYQWPNAGSVVEGLIIKKTSEGTTVEIAGQAAIVPSLIEIIEEIGDRASFEVIHGGDKPSLKYLRPDSNVRSVSDAANKASKPVVLAKDYQKIVDEAVKRMPSQAQQDIEAMVREAQTAVKALVEGLADGDLKQMMADGMDPAKTGIELVAQVLKHNKSLVMDREIGQLGQAVDREIKNLSKHYENEENLKEIVEILKSNNVQASKKHVDRLVSGSETIKAIKEISPDDAMDLLQKLHSTEVRPSVSEVYKLLHSPLQESADVAMSEKDLDYMVRGFLDNADMPKDESTIEAAKELVRRQIPVSQETIEYAKAPARVLSTIDEKYLMTAMAEKLAQGGQTKDVVIPEISKILEGTMPSERAVQPGPLSENTATINIDSKRVDELDKVLKQVRQMTNIQMVKAVNEDRHHTLKEAVSELASNEKHVVDQSLESLTKEAITFKRQLSEIQLKLTLEVALGLEKQGISVDTEPVEILVDRLKAEETALAAIQVKAYSESPDINKTLDNIQEVSEIKEAVARIKAYNSYGNESIREGKEDLLALMSKSDKVLSIANLQEELISIEDETIRETVSKHANYSVQDARNRYDASMTEIRPDLGDRIEKTFDQIEPLLKEMSLPVTEANIKAVKSLARNTMAITEESILDIQIRQEKIDLIGAKLTPALVVKLVQSDIHPISMALDELITVINAYEGSGDEQSAAKISELIHGMDQSGRLASDERQTMMAIYRTMDTVVRSKGAATGFMVKNDLPMTMDGLFEAAKYIRKTRQVQPAIKANVDDNFGLLEKVSNEDDLIKSKLPEGQTEVLRKELMDLRITSFIRELNPDNIRMMTGDQSGTGENIGRMPLEEVTDLIRNHVTTPESQTLDAEAYLKAIQAKPEMLRHMVDAGIPLTFDNFTKAVAMDRDVFLMMDEVTRLVDSIESPEMKAQAVTRLTEVSEGILRSELSYEALKEVIEEVEDMVRYGAEEPSPETFKAAQSARASANHVQMLQISEDYYQIPVYIAQEISQLNMYILNQEKLGNQDTSDMKVLMSLEAGSLGKVQAMISLQGNAASMQIQSTYPEDRQMLQKYEQAFTKVIESTNFSLKAISYEQFEAKEPVEVAEKVETKRAYEALNGHIDWTV